MTQLCRERTHVLPEEKNFYEGYRWALVPFLSFGQIAERVQALISEDLSSRPDWCKVEWGINLYMLSAAAADIADDYLVKGVYNFSKLSDYVSIARRPVDLLRDISIFSARLRGSLLDGGMKEWRGKWAQWLLTVSGLLIDNRVPDGKVQNDLREALSPLIRHDFPEDLLSKRIRIPAAYRSQDLTHHDFVSLGSKYAEKNPDRSLPYLVVGLRTAGSYIAPLISAYLMKQGYEQVSHITLRPKNFVHPWDEERLRNYIKPETRIVIADEPPSTGKTIARCIEILKDSGDGRNNRTTVLAPTHPAKRDWLDASIKALLSGVEIISLAPEEWHKHRLLEPGEFRTAVLPYFTEMGFEDIEVSETEETERINRLLSRNPDNSYHVRLKKVFCVSYGKDAERKSLYMMAKSVGWGWLGYHAALAADTLRGFTPSVYGIKNGMMFLEWVKDREEAVTIHEDKDALAEKLSAYISQRTNKLRLHENPMPFLSGYLDGGLQSIAIILSKAYGPKVSKLKRDLIRKALEKLECPVPTFLDSRMSKNEWVDSTAGLVKTDFEHHGFSKTASHNIVDPAYDISVAMLEFELSGNAEDKLLDNYIRNTGDRTIHERLFFYKLLAGEESLTDSLGKLNRTEYSPAYSEFNDRYVRSWNFLVSETTRHSAGYCEGEPVRSWGSPLFIMDIDDVLDKNFFGFPSTTANGILAVSMLRKHGICSAFNTARSLEEVRLYCKHYGFAGAGAEYGSVIWDAIRGRAEVQISEEALRELDLVRQELSKIPGVFVNPSYKYSIRAYSFDRQRTVPIPVATVGTLFSRLGIAHLSSKRSYIDTAICARTIDKGTALLGLKRTGGLNGVKTYAIGDSDADLPMLIAADKGFLVNNSTIQLKRTARNYGVTVVRSSFQSGLLEAVDSLLHGGKGKNNCEACRSVVERYDNSRDLYFQTLKVADESELSHWLHAFDRNIFKMF